MDDDEQEQELSDVDEDTDSDEDEEDEPQLTAEEERQLRHWEDTLNTAIYREAMQREILHLVKQRFPTLYEYAQEQMEVIPDKLVLLDRVALFVYQATDAEEVREMLKREAFYAIWDIYPPDPDDELEMLLFRIAKNQETLQQELRWWQGFIMGYVQARFPHLAMLARQQAMHVKDQAKLETLYPKISASDDEEEVCDLLVELTPW